MESEDRDFTPEETQSSGVLPPQDEDAPQDQGIPQDQGAPQNQDTFGERGDTSCLPADAREDDPDFSASTHIAPPVTPSQRPPRAPQKNNTALIAVAVTLLSIVFIVVVSVAAYVLSGHEISISNSGLDLFPYSGSDEGSSDGYGYPETGAGSTGAAIAESVPKASVGSGTVLMVQASPADGERLTFQELYRRCIPSILSVEVTTNDGFSSGTGVVISEDGYLITNSHVIDGAQHIVITLANGDEYVAALVGRDTKTDIAVLKIDADNLTPAEFGDSGSLEVGEEVAAIGNPLGLNFTLSNGIISAMDREMNYDGYVMTMLQTNAALNEGNSGGPLINMYGQVVGITNMKMYSYYSTVEGMGFAIPSSLVKSIVDELLSSGYISGRPTIGITAYSITESDAEYYDQEPGIYVQSVHEDSDAYAAGIREGDMITAVNGVAVSTTEELNAVKNDFSVGDRMTLTVSRDGRSFDLDVTLVDSNDLA